MADESIQFDVVTYDECPSPFVEVIRQTGGSVYMLKNPKTTNWQAFKYSFIGVLEANKYDIIYCHINGYRVLPYYYYAKRYSDAAFYVHSHSSHYPKSMLSVKDRLKIRMDQLINRKVTDKVVGCGSLSIKNIFGDIVKDEEMMVIPNSVEVDRFIKNVDTAIVLRNMNRSRYHLEDNELVIGHIGRLEEVKNHELTIRLAEYIKYNRLRMKILIIGEGNREAELKEQVDKKGLIEVITFTGRISPIEDFFPALDVMLLPSFAEGLPTVVVEAQASGVPVVMSDTITEEVDLGFGMLETVSLDSDITQWVEAIKQVQIRPIPEAMTREQVIKEKKFSNKASAELYANFLTGAISYYLID